MSRQSINTGTNPNDGTGDLLRAAMVKIEENFAELYNKQDQVAFDENKISATAIDSNLILSTSGTGVVSIDQGLIVNSDAENSISKFQATDDTTQIYIDPQNKRVGINTATPSNALSVVGNIDVSGTADIGGNVTISGSKITIASDIFGDLIPGTAGYDLGSELNRWQKIYATEFFATTANTNVVGNVTGDVVGNVTGNITGNLTTTGTIQLQNGAFTNQFSTDTLTSSHTTVLPNRSGTLMVAAAAPVSSVGISTDRAGHVAFDNDYFYYCVANHDGSTAIWKRAALTSW